MVSYICIYLGFDFGRGLDCMGVAVVKPERKSWQNLGEVGDKAIAEAKARIHARVEFGAALAIYEISPTPANGCACWNAEIAYLDVRAAARS